MAGISEKGVVGFKTKIDRSYDSLAKTGKAITRFLNFGNRNGGDFSELTKMQYVCAFDIFFDFVGKEYDEVSVEDFEDYYIHLKNKDYSKASIRLKIMSVKAFYRYLKDRKKIESNPAVVKMNNNDSQNRFIAEVPKQILTRSEVDKLLNTARNPRDNCILATFYGLGLRVSELCKLNVDDIDLEKNIILIDGKGNKRRICDLKNCLSRRIKHYLMIRGDQKTDALFTTKYGGRFIPLGIREILNKYVKRAGIDKKITPHSLRHTMITHAIEDSVPLPAISKFVGHSSITTTMLYTHVAKMDSNPYLEKFRDF